MLLCDALKNLQIKLQFISTRSTSTAALYKQCHFSQNGVTLALVQLPHFRDGCLPATFTLRVLLKARRRQAQAPAAHLPRGLPHAQVRAAPLPPAPPPAAVTHARTSSRGHFVILPPPSPHPASGRHFVSCHVSTRAPAPGTSGCHPGVTAELC